MGEIVDTVLNMLTILAFISRKIIDRIDRKVPTLEGFEVFTYQVFPETNAILVG